MILRKLMPVLIILLLILQIITAFIVDSSVMAIIGCLIVLICAIRWDLYGGVLSATLCAMLVLTGQLLSILQGGEWLLIIITVVLYYLLGVGIGGVLDTIRKQKATLIASEARYISANQELAGEKDKLGLTLSSISDGVITTDENGNIIMMNKVASELTGWEIQDALNRSFGEIFDIAYENSSLYNINLAVDVLRQGRMIELDENIILASKDGIKSNITVSISPVKQTEGNIIGTIVIFHDITKLKKSEDAAKLSEKKYSNYIENAPDGIIIFDENGHYLEVNWAGSKMTGYSKEELLQMTISDILTEKSKKTSVNLLENLLENGSGRGSLQYKHKDGTEKWMTFDAIKLTAHSFLGFTKDNTYEKKVVYLSYHDQLTGLGNRRFYEEEVKRIDTKNNLPLTLVMGDINGLKLFNDSFGHNIGDQLLMRAAEAIKSGCREGDVIARIGGDEFVILLPKTDAFKADKIVKRIQDLLSIEKVSGMDISISFGYSTKSNEEENIQEIFVQAENLMYQHKRSECIG